MANQDMNDALAEAGRRADIAWDSITHTWENWLETGEWFVGARKAAMFEARTNEPVGKGYNLAFGRWLEQRKFRNMDQGDRKRLFDCMEHRVEIEAWRATLTLGERLRLNHPSTVLRKWKTATAMPDPKAPKKISPMAQLHDRNVALQEEVDSLKRRLEDNGDGDSLKAKWLANKDHYGIAEAIIDMFGKGNAQVIAERIKTVVNERRREALDKRRAEKGDGELMASVNAMANQALDTVAGDIGKALAGLGKPAARAVSRGVVARKR